MKLNAIERWSLCKLGHTYYHGGHFDEAQKIFRGLCALNQNDHYAYVALGHIAMQQKQFVQALSYYRQALNIRPDDEEIMLALYKAMVCIPEERLEAKKKLEALLEGEQSHVSPVRKTIKKQAALLSTRWFGNTDE